MIHHWNGLGLDITGFEYHHDPTQLGETIPSQTSNLKRIEIVKASNESTQDTSLERFLLGDHRF